MTYKKLATFVAVYFATLFTVHYVHFAYFSVDVVFYGALLDVLFSSALVGGGLFVRGVAGELRGADKAVLLLVGLLGGYGFAITVPTVIDRSLSFYILEKVQQSNDGIKLTSMPDLFRKEYMREHRLVDIRLTEQLESGTIRINENCVRLTPRGEFVASFGRFYRSHFLPERRLIRGEYTDVLTRPYDGKGGPAEKYSCS